MKNEPLKNCPLCEKLCPIDQPSCPRGREMRRLCGEDPAREADFEGAPRCRREPFFPERASRPSHRPDFPPQPDFPPRPERGFGPRHGFGPHPEQGGPEGFRAPRVPRFERPPLPQDDSLASLLLRASHRLHRGGGNLVQDRILTLLAREGTLSQQTIQEYLHIRPGSVSELLSKLEAKGLLQRERDEADKRKVTLSLTEAGKAAAPNGEGEFRDAAFEALTEEERAQLRALLKKLLGESKTLEPGE